MKSRRYINKTFKYPMIDEGEDSDEYGAAIARGYTKAEAVELINADIDGLEIYSPVTEDDLYESYALRGIYHYDYQGDEEFRDYWFWSPSFAEYKKAIKIWQVKLEVCA